jgi:hypothetical protein
MIIASETCGPDVSGIAIVEVKVETNAATLVVV